MVRPRSAGRARAERDALLDELARATGLDGRPRTAGSSQERARVAVQKAISAAIDRIATVDAAAGRHLQPRHPHGAAVAATTRQPTTVDWVLD